MYVSLCVHCLIITQRYCTTIVHMYNLGKYVVILSYDYELITEKQDKKRIAKWSTIYNAQNVAKN